MTAKEYLQQAYMIDRKIQLDSEKLAAARSALYGRSVRYDRDGSKPLPQSDGTENAVLRVLELEEHLHKEIDRLTEKRQEIEQAVDSVPDEIQREVLTRRYLLYQKWEFVAEEMNYSERHIRRLHGYALKNLSLNVRF